MKKITLVLATVILALKLTGQINEFGIPLIHNYSAQLSQGSEQNWCITKDTFGNTYFGSQDRGIIRYDGTRWTTIMIGNNPRIYSLAADSTGIVYVGAAFEFGYIQPDEKGTPEYISLSNRLDSIPEVRNINSIALNAGKVYFLSSKVLYLYDIQTDSVTKLRLVDQNLNVAFRIINISGHLIIADNVEGFFELKENTLQQLPGGEFFRSKICTVLLPYDENQLLIGTYYNGIYLYNYKTGDINSNIIDNELNERLKVVSVYCGTKLGQDIYAFGTTNTEGLLVFNKTGKLIQQINAGNSDLEDNAMMAMYCDHSKNSELWLSTLGFISKIHFNIPLTNFKEKQGIEDGINEICRFNGSFYLSSDAGVLKSYVNEQNSISFSKVAGISGQVFPLAVVTSASGDILLAGSINGVFQISGSGMIQRVEDICSGLPKNFTLSWNVRKIVQSKTDQNIVYFGLEQGGIIVLNYDGRRWTYKSRILNLPGMVSGLSEKQNGGLWILTDDPSALYSYASSEGSSLLKYGPEKGIPDIDLNSFANINDDFFVTTAKGILKYDHAQDLFKADNSITGNFSEGKNGLKLFRDDEGDLWFSGSADGNFDVLIKNSNPDASVFQGIMKLLPNAPALDIKYYDDKVYFIKSKIISVIDKPRIKRDTTSVTTLFNSISIGHDSIIMKGSFYKIIDNERRVPVLANPVSQIPDFGYDFNNIKFEWTTPEYTEELRTEYSYILEGFDEAWSKWEGISFGNTMEAIYPNKVYENLPYGHYKFRVKTITLTGREGNEIAYEFVINKPWYATVLAYLVFALVAFLIVLTIIKAYTKKLKNENLRLEGIVAERTAVVVKQKDELESSIHYASRIQMALLPSEEILAQNIKNCFVLFKPRDIVSGDFYWMTKKGERLYIVAADCTGHGVPGAFMSLLGMSFLDEIIDKDVAPRADYVLNQLRLHVTESLKQVGEDNETKDGMDIALLVIDYEKKKIEFSGAYNPCFKVRKLTSSEAVSYKHDSNEASDGSMSDGKYLLETLYGSKMPIGISSRMNEDFVFHESPLENGTCYYLFSDGYLDQFGGQDGRKFMKKNFKKLLLGIQEYPMKVQKQKLEDNLTSWMGNSPQVDDILVMGIKTE